MSKPTYPFGPIAIFAAVVVAWFLVVPRFDQPDEPGAGILASPAIAPGQVGGLLPDVRLRRERTDTIGARAMRPGVVLLVAPDCGCEDAVRHISDEAREVRLHVHIVEAGKSLDQVDALASHAVQGLNEEDLAITSVRSWIDPDGVVAETFGLKTNIALVVVRRDGVVVRIYDQVTPDLDVAKVFKQIAKQPS